MNVVGKSMIAGVFLVATLASAGEPAVLKQVHVSDEKQIDFLFDKPISESQIKTEFVRDIVQVSVQGASVYPAKILTVNNSEVNKVFAYQYTPSLVRCRLTVKGNAENYSGRLKVKVAGRLVSVLLDPSQKGKDAVSAASAQAIQKGGVSAEESKLLDKVTQNSVINRLEAKAPISQSLFSTSGSSVGSSNLTSSGLNSPEKSSPRSLPFSQNQFPIRPFLWLGLILFTIPVAIFLLRKMLRAKSVRTQSVSPEGSKNLKSKLGDFISGKLGRQEKMIEVVATHYLGQKERLAVVRIRGQQLLLGITSESINLIAQLNDDGDLESLGGTLGEIENLKPPKASGAGATTAGAPSFSFLLNKEEEKPAAEVPVQAGVLGARDRIRRKIEGLKSL